MFDCFKFFGIVPSIDLNLAQLESKYVELQKLGHPDQYFLQSEKEVASDYMSKLNYAYRILNSFSDRVWHFIQCKFGVNVVLDMPRSVIEEVMELQEKMMSNPDDDTVNEEIAKCVDNMRDAIISSDDDALLTNFLKFKCLSRIARESKKVCVEQNL